MDLKPRGSGRDGKEEGGAAASQRGEDCASLGYRLHHFEQESGWIHALSWPGANSAPAGRIVWGGHDCSICRGRWDVTVHGVAERGGGGGYTVEL